MTSSFQSQCLSSREPTDLVTLVIVMLNEADHLLYRPVELPVDSWPALRQSFAD